MNSLRINFLHLLKIISLSTFCCLCGASFAEIYKWVDENGEVHFSDNKPEKTLDDQKIEKIEQKIKVNTSRSHTITPPMVDFRPSVKLTDDTSFKYYEIRGHNSVLVMDKVYKLNLGGHKNNLRSVGTALTQFKTKNIKFHETNAGCRITSAEVHLSSVITLPKWVDVDQASVEKQKKWGEIESHIAKHELKHKEITMNKAKQMVDYLKSGIKDRNCIDFKIKIDKQERYLSRMARSENNKFDNETYFETQSIFNSF